MAKAGGLVKAETPMKIEHLFTMTGGMSLTVSGEELEEGRRASGGKCSTVAMMDYLAKIPLAFEPGESWRYSLCHDVLAAIVEVVSGKRFGLFAKERIFDPLGMRSSTFLLPEKELGKVCAQYRYFEDRGYVNVGKEIQDFKFGSESESGGAGLVRTVEDYIQFLEGLRLGKILNTENILTSKNSGLNAGFIEAVKLDLGLDGDESAVWRGDGSHLA